MFLFLPRSILNRIQSIMSRFLWCGKISGPVSLKWPGRTVAFLKRRVDLVLGT